MTGYPTVPPHPSFPALEREVLDFWAADGTFAASVEQRPAGEDGANEYVFYDGPPFANGLPHYGHLLTGYVKDVVPRYRTMRGRRVERRFGWDTHGLPAETETEKQLGLKSKKEIDELGVAAFNEACRESVLRYTDECAPTSPARPAGSTSTTTTRPLDLDHPYPHCWRCGNPLIRRAVDSWFVQVTAFRDRMVELNQQITWVPEHVRDGQFGKWLEGARAPTSTARSTRSSATSACARPTCTAPTSTT